MSSQTTRLELTILGAALLVLLLCRQPPRSGNADVRTDMDMATQEITPGAEDAAQETNGGPVSDPLAPADERRTPGLQTPTSTPAPNSIAPDNSDTESTVPSQSKKRMGRVDARNCGRLQYKDVLYGEVSVRWVWDGEKLVPHKVIEVKEKNGVTSIWSFDEQKDVVPSGVQQKAP